MERLAHRGIIRPKIARHRMDSQWAVPFAPCDGRLDFINEGYHIAGIARIATREMRGKNKARGGLRDDPWLAPKLSRTVAFALEDRGNSTVIGIDDFVLAQPFALGQTPRLLADVTMGLQGDLQVVQPACTLGFGQMGGALEALLCGLGQGGNGVATLQKLLFSLAHQADKDFALATALAAKAAHDLREGVMQGVGLRFQRGRCRGAVRRDGPDELEDFFWAL